MFYYAGGHKRRKGKNMLNDVKLQGRLTAKPELRTTKTEKKVISFSLAVARNGKDAGTDFIQIVAWNKTAEFIAENCDKGQMIIVEAQLQSRSVTDNTTNKTRTIVEVVANQVHFCGSKAPTVADEAQDAPELEEYE